MNAIKNLGIILCLCLASNVVAQNTVNGILVDSLDRRIDGAAVVVMNATDSSSMAWEYSKNGVFSIQYNNPENKKLLLFVQAYGYENICRELTEKGGAQDMGKLTLIPLNVNIDAVAVTADAVPKYAFERGRDLFTIPPSMGEQEFDLNTLLSQIPGLAVDGEKVSIIGRGAPNFTINGLPPRPDELKQLSPRDVEKISIDRMPSARYDKNVTGIIDIITRKKVKDFLNLRVTNDFRLNNKPGNYTGIYINNKVGRWTNYLSYGYNYINRYYESIYTNTLYAENKEFVRIYTQKPHNISHTHSLNLGPKFQINDKSYIDLQYSYDGRNSNGYGPKTFDIVGYEQDLSSGTGRGNNDTHNLLLRYVYETKKGNRLFVNGGYSSIGSKGHTINNEEVTDTDGNTESIKTEYNDQYTSSVATFSANYEYAMKHGLFSEAGLEFAEIWNDGSIIYKGGERLSSSTEETQAAAYFDIGQKIGKFHYRVGVRGEYLYKYRATNSDANKNPFSFLPSASLSYDVSKAVNMILYFRRSTTHPTVSERDPILSYVNKYEYSQGNPELKSSIENELAFRIRLPHNLAVGVGYNYVKDPIILVDDIYNIDKQQTILTYHNFPQEKALKADITWTGRFNFYTLFLNGTYNQTWSQSPFQNGFVDLHKPMFGIRVQQVARIVKGLALNVVFNYKTSYDYLYTRNYETYDLSASLTMSLFKRRVNVNVACNNIFYANDHTLDRYKSIMADNFNRMFNRQFRLGITYNFNNFKEIFQKNDSNANVLERVQ